MEIKVRNVNEAFKVIGEKVISREGFITQDSRNGPVLRCVEPMNITYTHPWERVLGYRQGQSNPFFNVAESIWMMAGSNVLSFLTRYVKTFVNYSDDGESLHGAYGERWFSGIGVNQIDIIIKELTQNPTSRRCVLQMWDADPLGSDDLNTAISGGRDVPCNLVCVFQMVEDRLDMTVYNRSNDLVWGTLGANAYHFSFLHQFVAEAVGQPQGHYHQISCNAHVYLKNSEFETWLEKGSSIKYSDYDVPTDILKNTNHSSFHTSCQNIVMNNQLLSDEEYSATGAVSPYFRFIVHPMLMAHKEFKKGRMADAVNILESKMSGDIQLKQSALEWLESRT